jgi:hypothetical protein
MLQGEALRRRGERSSPLQACFDFATSLFGLGSARVSRVGDRVLAIADFSPDCFGETHALSGTGKDAQSLNNEL